jgi:predicted DCC family thiol-disulfide oxidoreductase YuxK
MTTAPRQHVALYDGTCGLCRAGVDRLRRRAAPGAIEFRDLHADGALDAFPGLTREACMEAMHLVLPDGRAVRGAEAVARALLTRPVLGAYAWLYYVPGLRQLAEAVYAAIARRRYRLSVRAGLCEDGICHAP